MKLIKRSIGDFEAYSFLDKILSFICVGLGYNVHPGSKIHIAAMPENTIKVQMEITIRKPY